MILVRELKMIDIEDLAELTTELGYPTNVEKMKSRILEISKNENIWTFVAEQNNKIIGYVGFSKNYSWEQDGCFIRVQALVVKKEKRKLGIGKKLIDSVEELAKIIGAKSIALNCGNRTEREDAHSFYKRIGFEAKTTGYRKQIN